MILNQEQLKAYFNRIGLCYEDYKNRPLDGAFLGELCFAHSTAIPFENLDMLHATSVSLDGPTLYDKIITKRRGGLCFELNGISSIFLRSLGFGVQDLSSRFFRDAKENEIPMQRHRLLKVEAEDGTFIWDIGIGQRSPRYPLRLAEGLVQKQCGEIYKLQKETFYEWVLYEYHKEQWLRILSFTEQPQIPADFIPACAWCELHPNSPFRVHRMVAIKTEDGRKSIDDNTFKIFKGEQVEVFENLTEAEIQAICEEHFGLCACNA